MKNQYSINVLEIRPLQKAEGNYTVLLIAMQSHL